MIFSSIIYHYNICMKKLPFIVDNKIIYINEEITRNKNMYLKVTKDNEILLTHPLGISSKQINKFVYKNIKKFLNYVTKESNKILYSIKDNFIYYNGKKFKIFILTGFLKQGISLKDNTFYIESKIGSDGECKKIIEDHFAKVIFKYIKKRQPHFEKIMNVPSHKIKVAYKFSTWGANNIQLKSISYSSRLMHFDDETKDYLIVHELAHCLVHNHGKQFYEVLKEFFPNYKVVEIKLSKRSKINDM